MNDSSNPFSSFFEEFSKQKATAKKDAYISTLNYSKKKQESLCTVGIQI